MAGSTYQFESFRIIGVSSTKGQFGKVLRLIASRGWTTEDPDVLGELVERAHRLATAVVDDESASMELHALADAFLAHLEADRFA